MLNCHHRKYSAQSYVDTNNRAGKIGVCTIVLDTSLMVRCQESVQSSSLPLDSTRPFYIIQGSRLTGQLIGTN